MATLTRSVRGSSNQLLYHVLEEPQLLAAVRELPAPVLVRLIEHVGLEDAGELIALTSTQQLGQVFDAELFQSSAPGADESFRPDRFALFLRLMYEAGESFVVERLLALPRELLTLAFHKLLLVIDIDALTVRFNSAGRFDDGMDRVTMAIDNALFEEWEEFRLIARDANAFDDVWNALLALDREDHELVRDVIERCCDMDGELMEESGLYALLNQEEELESDIVAARSERRAAAGYVAAADARAFLELAGRESIDEAPDGRDPITRAYFRELEPEPVVHGKPAMHKSLAAEGGKKGHAVPADLGRLLAVLKEAKVMDDEPDMPTSLKLMADEGQPRLAGAAAARSPSQAPSRFAEPRGHHAGKDAIKAAKRTVQEAARAAKGAKARGLAKPGTAKAGTAKAGTTKAGTTKAGRAGGAAGDAGAQLQPQRAADLHDAHGDAKSAAEGGKRLTLMAAAMLELRARDAALHAQRTEELGFLANVLVAGSRHDGRSFRPVEAIEAALAICSVGLERAYERPGSKQPSTPLSAAEASSVLEQLSADRLFRAGQYALRVEVTQPASAKIAALLGVNVRDVLEACSGGAAALLPELALNAEDAVAIAALAEEQPWLAGKLTAQDHVFVNSQAEVLRACRFVARCELSIADRQNL